MARIFLSHSSKDRAFARDLYSDLTEMDHEVWIDEHQVLVGDSIPAQISTGIAKADYIVVVLTDHAIRSGWVTKEWMTRLSEEVTTGRTIVLPVLKDDCDIPQLLGTKRYADFRRRYAVGFAELAIALNRGASGDLPPALSKLTDGIERLKSLIDAIAPKTGILLAFDRSSAILSAAVGQVMHLPEILVINRDVGRTAEGLAKSSGITIGIGVRLEPDKLSHKGIAVVKYHMLTGETVRQGLLFLRDQGFRSDPPVFSLFASKIAMQRWPGFHYVFEHPDPEKTLGLFPWNREDIQLI